MRNNENNIIFNVRNITLNLKNITAYFTEKEKFLALRFKNIILNYRNITLSLLILILSSINIINTFTYISNVSALDYSSNVGVGFTFNPTLSISLSSSDLVISNLAPGSSADSNSINVSVATNAAYGYTLSAIMDGDNSNLTHSNSIDTFNSIDPSANLETLTVDNTWGYTSKLNNETIWNNYNGLSSSSNTILLDNNNTADSTGGIDFKIAAKASNTQPSGEYTGTINFIAVTKVAPMSLLDSFIASGAEQLNGYFKMQDMTHDICNNVDIEESELQLIDVRDNKVYWVAKLKDGNCWMTQNLDLDLDSNRTYTHYDTDLGWGDPSNLDTNATWKPIRSTIDFTIGSSVSGWVDSYTEPSSANPGNVYFYTSNSDADDVQYNSLQECIDSEYSDCVHYHAGNYYNWSAAVAKENSNPLGSICPKNWRLPADTTQEFGGLLVAYEIIQTNTSTSYLNNGSLRIRNKPLYFNRSGDIGRSRLNWSKSYGIYWSSIGDASYAYGWLFNTSKINFDNNYTNYGRSLRCLAR